MIIIKSFVTLKTKFWQRGVNILAKEKRFWVLLALTLAWILFIFSNSMQIAEDSSEASAGIVEWLMGILKRYSISLNLDFLTFVVRKCAHFTEYLVLGALTSATVQIRKQNISSRIICILFTVMTVALCDETIQLFTDGRSSEVRDVWIDVAGGITGLLLAALIVWVNGRLRQKKQRA